MDPYAAIRSCIDTEGRITLYPAKRRKKLLVLAYLAERIPPDREYTEREFSEMLDTLHTFHDPATLRRELFDCFLIDRSADGKRYRRRDVLPDAQELPEKYGV